MKISLNWLREFVDVPINIEKNYLDKVVVGLVEELEKHPNADRLNVAKVNVGRETVQIVCGGTNLKADAYVPVALPGAVLPGNFEIKKAPIRGVESNGMICNQIELNIGDCDPKTIMLLPKKAEPGTAFADYLKLKGYSPKELGNLLTLKTAEVEEVNPTDKYLDHVYTGKLVSYEKIPNTEHHHKGEIDLGKRGKISIVFGSVFEVEEGIIVPVATAGAVLPSGPIKETKMHGTLSQGMFCTDKELGIENTELGFTIFPPDTPLGLPVAEALNLNDFQYEIDNKSLTHRPDLWGHYGIAREVAAITGSKLKPYKTDVKFPSKGEKLTIDIKNPELVPRFAACLMSGIEIKESPQWMKGRLQAAGVRPVNNIVDITNYVMLEYGQPMHAYDRDTVKTDKLEVKLAKKGEIVEAIDHKKYKLTEKDLIVTNGKDFLGIGGIMGGVDSEINDKTTNVIIEAANWHASTMRMTSQRLNLRSDASQRFEKSLDPRMCPIAVAKAVELVLEMCPNAKIVSPLVDVKNHKDTKLTTEVSVSRAQSKIGVKISAAEIKSILESLEFKVTKKSANIFKVEIPTFRATKDVSIEEDLVEEISRIYGYENIDPILPELPAKVPMPNSERIFAHKLRDLFSLELGFDEIFNYSFYGKTEISKSLLTEKNHVKVNNYLSEDQTHMRVSLIPNILRSVAGNIRNFKEFKLYEIGRTYINESDYFPLEEKQLAGALVEPKKNSQGFLKLKGLLEAAFKQLGYNYKFIQNTEPAPYRHPGKAAIIEINGQNLGHISALHPLAQKNWDLDNYCVTIFEINLNRLFTLAKPEKAFKAINKFPSIELDISVLVKKEKSVGEVQEIIEGSDAELITNVELFDLYEGDKIEASKKALAFRITLQAEDRTLTDEEMAKVQDKIFKRLMSNGGKIRGL